MVAALIGGGGWQWLVVDRKDGDYNIQWMIF